MKIFDVDFIAYWIVLSSIHYNLSNAWLPQYHNTLAYIMIHHHISRRAVILSKLLNEKDPLDGNNGFSHAQNLVLTYLFQGQLFSPRFLGKQNWILFLSAKCKFKFSSFIHCLVSTEEEGRIVVPESSLNVLWNEKEKASASLLSTCFDGLLRSTATEAAAAGTLGKPMSQQEGENNSLCN